LRDLAKIAAMIRTFELSKRFGRRQALLPTTLEIPHGGVTALVGPNGAGKSTLLKLCLGFERPTSGRLEVLGVDPHRDRARAVGSIGYVAQTPSLYRDITVDDHIALAGALRRGFDMDFARERVAALEISAAANVGELSGGEQAQVSLAIALGTRAPVLLLDEPLANLDPLARRDFLRVVSESARSGEVGIVLSSHVISEIEATATRLLVLGEGQVLFNDTVAHAIDAHGVVEDVTSREGLDVVSAYPGRRGEHLLIRQGSREVGRAPGLEEVVLGYLASAREQARRARVDRDANDRVRNAGEVAA
jgi:ABC-2 type transport system ATP-binding protein